MASSHVHNKTRSRFNFRRVDPTLTSGIRRTFQREIIQRFDLLRRDVIEFMVALDALGLTPRPSGKDLIRKLSLVGNMPNRSEGRSDSVFTIQAKVQPREFEFRTNPAKVKAFRDWLEEQINQRILKPRGTQDPDKPWTAKHIESAFKKGRTQAFARAKRKELAALGEAAAGKIQEDFLKTSFGSAERASKVELLATRSFEQLRGISAQMSQNMNRILAQGMIEGKGAKEIAKEMAESIDGLSRGRATTIARTEIVNAHAEGTLDAFEELGVEELSIMAEWSTAGDDRVCPQCEAMEGKVFTLDEARGMIPLHPNCRCTWIPSEPQSQK